MPKRKRFQEAPAPRMTRKQRIEAARKAGKGPPRREPLPDLNHEADLVASALQRYADAIAKHPECPNMKTVMAMMFCIAVPKGAPEEVCRSALETAMEQLLAERARRYQPSPSQHAVM